VNVLMAYATKNGSTRQVAEAIAVALGEAGAQVTALPTRGVRDSVSGYDLIVLGAPLYSGRWHRDAHRFLKRHRRELAAVPVGACRLWVSLGCATVMWQWGGIAPSAVAGPRPGGGMGRRSGCCAGGVSMADLVWFPGSRSRCRWRGAQHEVAGADRQEEAR